MGLKLNGIPVVPTIFPDRTSQVWKLPDAAFQDPSLVEWVFESEAEIVHLCQLKLLLDATGIQHVDLRVNYLPYARQDKLVCNDATFALQAFAQLLNVMRFDRVTFVDGHSVAATSLIDGAVDEFSTAPVYTAINSLGPATALVFPDEGAYSRYGPRFPEYVRLRGAKVRDAATGRITSMTIEDLHAVVGRDVLIIDDICDGGATFILLASKLLEAKASSVSLYVTHGIFSRGLEPLLSAGIRQIFTMNGKVQ